MPLRAPSRCRPGIKASGLHFFALTCYLGRAPRSQTLPRRPDAGGRAFFLPRPMHYGWILACALTLGTCMQPPPPDAPTPVPEPAETIRDLRAMILNLSAGEAGIDPTPALPTVWGVVLEIGYAEGLATLVALADGTTSLYLGHGGGYIGMGAYDAVRDAARRLLEQAEASDVAFTAPADFPLPHVGQVRFYVLTHSGVVAAGAREADVGGGTGPLTDLYAAAHAVITEIRLQADRRDE